MLVNGVFTFLMALLCRFDLFICLFVSPPTQPKCHVIIAGDTNATRTSYSYMLNDIWYAFCVLQWENLKGLCEMFFFVFIFSSFKKALCLYTQTAAWSHTSILTQISFQCRGAVSVVVHWSLSIAFTWIISPRRNLSKIRQWGRTFRPFCVCRIT